MLGEFGHLSTTPMQDLVEKMCELLERQFEQPETRSVILSAMLKVNDAATHLRTLLGSLIGLAWTQVQPLSKYCVLCCRVTSASQSGDAHRTI